MYWIIVHLPVVHVQLMQFRFISIFHSASCEWLYLLILLFCQRKKPTILTRSWAIKQRHFWSRSQLYKENIKWKSKTEFKSELSKIVGSRTSLCILSTVCCWHCFYKLVVNFKIEFDLKDLILIRLVHESCK